MLDYEIYRKSHFTWIQAVLLYLLALPVNGKDCGNYPAQRLKNKEGKITDADVHVGRYKWTFEELPNKTAMIVLNMTKDSYYGDIKLNDEDFVVGEFYCNIFKYGKINETEAQILKRKYPMCRLAHKQGSGITITFCDSQDFSLPPKFTITYKTIPTGDFFAEDEDQRVATSQSTTTTKDSSAEELKSRSLIITLAILGTLLGIFVLLFFLFAFRRYRERKNPVESSERETRVNDVYHTIQDNGSTAPSNGVAQRESSQNVINPLYDTTNKPHSYEYIELRLPEGAVDSARAV